MRQMLLALLLGASIIGFSSHSVAEQEAVILINPFEVPAGKLDATLAMWEKARDFLQTQPGYIATELHQSLAPDARFRLINVAKWESHAAFMAAISKMRTQANLPRIEGVIANPALYSVVRRD
ncbi:MAG: antibiotic biosynthesis monooxygenase family protein [Pseudomonadota bacterium]